MDFNRFQKLLRSSKSYEFDDTRLTITDYHTGERVTIDLSLIGEETYTEMLCEDEDQKQRACRMKRQALLF